MTNSDDAFDRLQASAFKLAFAFVWFWFCGKCMFWWGWWP
jgi:hypothetical protein